jgi:TadE-like protein
MALVMPLLLGIVAILLQFGVRFSSYLSLVHATRDIARFVAVHPDTADGAPPAPTPPCSVAGPPAAEPTPATLWDHICRYDVPSVIDKNKIQDLPIATPACTALDANGHCPARQTGTAITINMSYDARSNIFLPQWVRWGPWLSFNVPANFTTMTYDYTVMVEPH